MNSQYHMVVQFPEIHSHADIYSSLSQPHCLEHFDQIYVCISPEWSLGKAVFFTDSDKIRVLTTGGLTNRGSFSQITHMYSSNLVLPAAFPNYLPFSKYLFSKTFSVTLCGLPVSPVRRWKFFCSQKIPVVAVSMGITDSVFSYHTI